VINLLCQGITDQEQINWRRDKVLQLAADGYSIREIASILKISHAAIGRDIILLRQQAKQHIRQYIDERLPFEYHKCLVGLDAIVRRMSDIVNSEAADSRDVLQATSVKMQAYAMKIDLLSNATVIEKAVHFIDRHRGLMPQNNELVIDGSDSAGSISR
jgi:hypothetical protein